VNIHDIAGDPSVEESNFLDGPTNLADE